KADGSLPLSRRGIHSHVEPGDREKAVTFAGLIKLKWGERELRIYVDGGDDLKEARMMVAVEATVVLLAKDPALEPFKSHKKSVKRLKRVGDVLTMVVVAGCCYEIYVRAVMREEARKQARESANS
ncbi:hypothetical protein RJ639_034634, partial [Escallonia herrerae]